jgi:hypothetical protein
MRMIVIKQTMDLKDVGSKLIAKSATSDAALNELKVLNPHVDFKKIEPGTVLFVPDSPGFKATETDSIEGDAFDDLSGQLQSSVNDASDQVARGWSDLLAEEKDVAAAFKIGVTTKRGAATDVDPALKALIDAANAQFKQDQANAKTATDSMKAMEGEVEAELGEIGKLLR